MKVLRFSLLLWVVLLLISCRQDGNKSISPHPSTTPVSGNKKSVFNITGKGLPDKTKIILLNKSPGDKMTTMLETQVTSNGYFTLSFLEKLPVDIYYLQWGKDKEIPLLIDNSDLEIQFQNGVYYSLSGQSDLQQKYGEYLRELSSSENPFIVKKKFVLQNKNSLMGAAILKDMLGPTRWRMQQTESLYEKLGDNIKTLPLSQEISSYLNEGLSKLPKEEIAQNEAQDPKPKQTEIQPIVTPAPKTTPQPKPAKKYVPYFYAYDLDGNEVSAKRIFNKNKLIYIDFWASWCVPCRNQNPDLVRLYAKYKNKGFEIISVSQEREVEKCRNASLQDNITWTNVIDSNSLVSNMYQVHSIPDGFLVDHEGGIIAKNLGAGRLEEFLIRHFGE
jgi:thiol-disulfide isomerase/thioredoxin